MSIAFHLDHILINIHRVLGTWRKEFQFFKDHTCVCKRLTSSLARSSILGLRTHLEDIKGAISVETVGSLTPLHWRSDLPDFETRSGGQLDERVVFWTHQVHVHDVQTSSSEVLAKYKKGNNFDSHEPPKSNMFSFGK
ncbi:hypothetical protein BDR04DRAFT_1095237 [Suillus decipiens]|nr:hypothetical protein BDR04DRAFT_1095237 [Suillus decipiens]